MKTTIINSIKPILSDRLMVVLTSVFVIVVLVYCVYVAVSLQPSDLQVAVHYTTFGETNFYREKWFYLINFIAFGLIVAVVHSVLAVKIYLQGRRPIALLFLWLSMLLIAVAFLLTRSVLNIAFL
jgi:hypothetical protein